MKRSFLLLFAGICFFLILTAASHAQPNKGKAGIAVAVQNPQLDIGIPIWVGEKVVLTPSFGLLHASGKATELVLGLAVRGYIEKAKLSSYGGGRFGSFILSPKNGDTVNDFLLGLFFGAEHFWEKHFSLAGEIQLNAGISGEFSNRFGNPDGVNLNTAAVLIATFYF